MLYSKDLEKLLLTCAFKPSLFVPLPQPKLELPSSLPLLWIWRFVSFLFVPLLSRYVGAAPSILPFFMSQKDEFEI